MTETIDRSDELAEMFNTDGTDAPVDPYAAFWEQRSVLRHIRDFARSRRVGPWAMLGVVLGHAAASTPPTVRLPALVGGAASLNIFVALVGPSGGGKGAAEAAAADGCTFCDYNGTPVVVGTHPVGSGEGTSRVYRPHGTDPDEPNPVTNAIFTAGEVDTLAALGGRSGSTLMPQLRHMYSGEQLGFANAGRDTRVVVGRHTYRAVLIVGVQPLKAGALLDDADGGTPQRFGWFPTGDEQVPDARPDSVDPRTVALPKWEIGTHEMRVPQEAVDAVDANRVAVLRGEAVDPLDGHALQYRIKVSAALAILDGRANVNGDDWELSAVIMEVSNNTRQVCVDAIREKARKANAARAHSDAERAEIIDNTRADKAVKRVAGVITRKLSRDNGTTSRADLRRAVAGKDRPDFDAAVDMLEAAGVVTMFESERGHFVTLAERPEGWRGGEASTGPETVSELHVFESGETSTPPPPASTSTHACPTCGGSIDRTGKCVPCLVKAVS